MSRILFTGGSASVHAGIPPAPDQTPLPPGVGTPHRAERAGRYGQQARGTHPTGMQSCFFMCAIYSLISFLLVLRFFALSLSLLLGVNKPLFGLVFHTCTGVSTFQVTHLYRCVHIPGNSPVQVCPHPR